MENKAEEKEDGREMALFSIAGLHNGYAVQMGEAMNIYKYHPEVTSAVRLLANTIMGRELTVRTENPKAKKFFEKTFIPKIKIPLKKAIEDMIVTGNGYIEILRGNASGKPLKYKHIANPHKMFIDFEKGFNPTKYVQEIKGYNKEEEGHTISYTGNKTRTVHGIAYDIDEVLHMRMGNSELPIYGRSTLCSCVDEAKIMREMMRNIAAIARYKTIAQKIISINNEDAGFSSEDKKKLQNELANMDDTSNLITDRNVEVNDLDYGGGQHQRFDEYMKWISKRISGTLAPSFYTHGDVTNYAVAKEQKNAFYLQIEAIRDQIKDSLNKLIREKAKYEGYDTDIELEFGEFDFPTRSDKIEEALNKFKEGAITLNEAREELGLDLEDDVGEAYKWELTQNEAQQAMENIKKNIED